MIILKNNVLKQYTVQISIESVKVTETINMLNRKKIFNRNKIKIPRIFMNPQKSNLLETVAFIKTYIEQKSMQ